MVILEFSVMEKISGRILGGSSQRYYTIAVFTSFPNMFLGVDFSLLLAL